MKQNTSKLARVAKDKGLFFLMQNQMIMFKRSKRRFFAAQFARHSQVNTEPGILAEAKEHLFSMREGFQKHHAGQRFLQQIRVSAAKDSFAHVLVHRKNFFMQPLVPLFSEELDFG